MQLSFMEEVIKQHISMQGHKKRTCFPFWSPFEPHLSQCLLRIANIQSQACSEDVFSFFQKQTNDSYRFISELMDYAFLMAGVHQQPDQSNYLAEGQT